MQRILVFGLDFLFLFGFLGQSNKHGLQVEFGVGKRSAQPEDPVVTQILNDVFRLDTCRQREAPHERIAERIVGAGDGLSFAFDDDHVLLKGDHEVLGLELGQVDGPLKQKCIRGLVTLRPLPLLRALPCSFSCRLPFYRFYLLGFYLLFF